MDKQQREDLATFVALLDRCKAQVEVDPDSVLLNPHLYEILHHVFLRLCGGNIPENEGRRADVDIQSIIKRNPFKEVNRCLNG